VQVLTEARPDALRQLVERGEFFWLDLVHPSEEEANELVDAIGLDREWAARLRRFTGVHPQIRVLEKNTGLVFYGAEGQELFEVQVFVSGGWVVTVHERPLRALGELREELSQGELPEESRLVARILQALADSFNEYLEPLDDRLEDIEEEAVGAKPVAKDTRTLRAEILQRRRDLLAVRRIVRRQRDYVERAPDRLSDIPGLEGADINDFRDLASQMIRVGDRLDDSLDTLSSSLDLLNSTISNRTNRIMERLTVVATIFLPLTLVTSYFGQNFAWMVNRVNTLTTFLIWGVGAFLASAVVIALWMRFNRATPD
jgi:magnesium transporter